jgi:hypothetical protein
MCSLSASIEGVKAFKDVPRLFIELLKRADVLRREEGEELLMATLFYDKEVKVWIPRKYPAQERVGYGGSKGLHQFVD